MLTLARWLSWGEPAFGYLNFVSYSPGVAQSDKRRGFSLSRAIGSGRRPFLLGLSEPSAAASN